MTVKEEVMIFWMCCVALLLFLLRHLLGAAECLTHQAAALSFVGLPGMLGLLAARIR